MPEIINEHEAARRLGLPVEEVVYRLDYGQMMGRQVDGGWQIDTRDLEFFRRGQALGRAIAEAGKAPVDGETTDVLGEVSPHASPGWRRNPEYLIDLEVVPARVRVECGGASVAESERTLLVMELGHGAVYYLPKADVDWSHFSATDHSSYCQYKGFARYWTLSGGRADRGERRLGLRRASRRGGGARGPHRTLLAPHGRLVRGRRAGREAAGHRRALRRPPQLPGALSRSRPRVAPHQEPEHLALRVRPVVPRRGVVEGRGGARMAPVDPRSGAGPSGFRVTPQPARPARRGRHGSVSRSAGAASRGELQLLSMQGRSSTSSPLPGGHDPKRR